MLKLYTYFRSTAAYRVRIALNIKNLEHELISVHLLKDGGEHKTEDYLNKNPMGLVPALEIETPSGEIDYLAQSLSILEYLEETYPENPILPADGLARVRVREISLGIACDMHPLNNLRVLKFLTGEMALSEEQKLTWYKHWIATGFTGIERQLRTSSDTGLCCHGDAPTMADLCLIPQVYNAERFDCPMDDYPTIQRINEHCKGLDAFAKADPAIQPDAV